MKVSIAMATYNGAKYLQAQLQSIVDQIRRPDELIITDDCSTDETESIVREFAKTAPFKVEFYRNEKNLGYCGNFNAALMKTTGDLVFLCDQDDVWFPEKIEHMIDVAERNPEALVVMNDAALTDGDLNNVGLTKIGQLKSAGFSMHDFVMGCCCAVRRDLLDFCLPIPDEFTAHDGWIVWFADGLKRKYVIETVLQQYRRHGANESDFLANSTVKVTLLHSIVHSYRRIGAHNIQAKDNEVLQQQTVFLEGIDRAGRVAKKLYGEELRVLYDQSQRQLFFLTKRVGARKKGFLFRLATVSVLACKGAYRQPSAIRALIRDLLGYR